MVAVQPFFKRHSVFKFDTVMGLLRGKPLTLTRPDKQTTNSLEMWKGVKLLGQLINITDILILQLDCILVWI